MRDDYYSKTQVLDLLRINAEKFSRITALPNAFPVFRVGVRYVIPKDKFFAWIHRTMDSGAFYRLFEDDHHLIIPDINHEQEVYHEHLRRCAVEKAKRRTQYIF